MVSESTCDVQGCKSDEMLANSCPQLGLVGAGGIHVNIFRITITLGHAYPQKVLVRNLDGQSRLGKVKLTDDLPRDLDHSLFVHTVISAGAAEWFRPQADKKMRALIKGARIAPGGEN